MPPLVAKVSLLIPILNSWRCSWVKFVTKDKGNWPVFYCTIPDVQWVKSESVSSIGDNVSSSVFTIVYFRYSFVLRSSFHLSWLLICFFVRYVCLCRPWRMCGWSWTSVQAASFTWPWNANPRSVSVKTLLGIYIDFTCYTYILLQFNTYFYN